MRPPELPRCPSPRGPWLLPLGFALVGAFAWACQDPGLDDGSEDDDASEAGDSDPGSEVTRRDVLASIGTHVIAPATAAFAMDAGALHTAVVALDDATLAGASPEDARAVAQTAWRDAASRWQQLEVMQVGPAGASLVADGGEDLRDAIYSWPTADSCSVDRALVEQDYLAADFFATQLVWAYGLDALEYLLFAQSPAHTCPAQVQLDGPWAALGTEELARRRSAYARVVSGGIVARADELAGRWAHDDGDFGALLAAPGEGDSPFADEADALDEVFRAMFYVELVTKDDKLGVPIGAQAGCAAVPCIDQMEAPHAGVAAAAIRENLEGLRQMVLGGPDAATGDGFDDLLAGAGEAAIASTLLARIDEAMVATEAFDASLQDELAADPEAAADLYAAVKAVTDQLKGPFVMALMLTIPAEGAGDND